ncbi:MAG: hypothetical protein IKN59_06345 [Paludibacteraceae bacterium]|nr:hypothetical protein [Paludibacteraceae bacterium]
MKKHLFIIPLLLGLAACDNEQVIVISKDSVPVVVMDLVDKPRAEAESYLESINYAKYVSRSESRILYYKPKELLNLLAENSTETLEKRPYEEMIIDIRYNAVAMAEGTQQFDSPKLAFKHFRAWLALIDRMMTDSTSWSGEITMYHSLDINDTPTRTNYIGGRDSLQRVQVSEEMGWSHEPREEFYKVLDALTADRFFQVVVILDNVDGRNMYIHYRTLEHQDLTIPSIGIPNYVVSTDMNKRVLFQCYSIARYYSYY